MGEMKDDIYDKHTKRQKNANGKNNRKLTWVSALLSVGKGIHGNAMRPIGTGGALRKMWWNLECGGPVG